MISYQVRDNNYIISGGRESDDIISGVVSFQLAIYSRSNVSTTLGESCENVGTFLLLQHIPGKFQECCHKVASKRCKKTSPQHYDNIHTRS